ncbi:MAG: hypothetical protein HZA08_01745 [Nitrospirae bacterium]|nr:hypothetical protein [Nitrospirota bacterium]
MTRKVFVVLLVLALFFCLSSITNAAINRISGNGYIFPETQTYKAIFAIDVSRDGVNTPSGLVKYYYSRTRMSMVSTSITDLTISGVGTTGTISGICSINNVSGYSFIMTLSDGRPDSI